MGTDPLEEVAGAGGLGESRGFSIFPFHLQHQEQRVLQQTLGHVVPCPSHAGVTATSLYYNLSLVK